MHITIYGDDSIVQGNKNEVRRATVSETFSETFSGTNSAKGRLAREKARGKERRSDCPGVGSSILSKRGESHSCNSGRNSSSKLITSLFFPLMLLFANHSFDWR